MRVGEAWVPRSRSTSSPTTRKLCGTSGGIAIVSPLRSVTFCSSRPSTQASATPSRMCRISMYGWEWTGATYPGCAVWMPVRTGVVPSSSPMISWYCESGPKLTGSVSSRRTMIGSFMAWLLSPVLEAHVFVGREGRHRDDVDGVIGHARSDAHQRAEVHHRREHHALDRQLLDAMEQRLPPAGIALARLLQEQVVEVGIAAVGVGALRVHEGLHATRGVARVARGGEEDAAQLLLAPGRVERRALHRPH